MNIKHLGGKFWYADSLEQRLYEYVYRNYKVRVIREWLWGRVMINLIAYDRDRLPVMPSLVEEGLKSEEYGYTYKLQLAVRGNNDLFAPQPSKIMVKLRRNFKLISIKQTATFEKLKKNFSEKLFGSRVSEGTFIKEKGLTKSYTLKKTQIFHTQIGTEDITEVISDYEKTIKAKFNLHLFLSRYYPMLTKLTFSELGVPLIGRIHLPRRQLLFQEDAGDADMYRVIKNYTRYSDKYKAEVNVNLEQKKGLRGIFENWVYTKRRQGFNRTCYATNKNRADRTTNTGGSRRK